jgi:hypothetical protein
VPRLAAAILALASLFFLTSVSCSFLGISAMPRAKLILGFAVLVVAVIVAWQFGSRELANIQLQDEMRDMASQAGVHVGAAVPKSDEEFVRPRSS